MARGIYGQWKFPIAYYLAHSGVNKNILKELIIDIVKKLFDVGLCPKLIVCDQSTSNQSALKLLNISEENPFFFVNGHKIFTLYYDVPHLLKSVRNNFIEACFQKDNKIFSFNDIKETYKIDKSNKKSKALIKITDSHIHPTSFQKMRVKLAVQVFSHSMSSAIRTCAETEQLLSKTAFYTADFIEFMNNLFDCLNSRSLFSHKTFLLEASKYFLNLTKIKKGKISQPPCFKGFTQTINAILQFFEEEKSNNIAFLITNRLNQDVLENLFSIFRQKGGYNKNPTARTIRTSIRSNCIFSIFTSTGTNCETPQETDDHDTIQFDIVTPLCTNTDIILDTSSDILNQIFPLILKSCAL